MRNVSEREAQGYYLRELEILRTDRVSPLLLVARCTGNGLVLEPPGREMSLFCNLIFLNFF